MDMKIKEFQSTPSVGRATTTNLYRASNTETFQSTPSVGRATDDMRYFCYTVLRFQSTPSVGRATLTHIAKQL